ncbi:MAG TPA: stage II sporulation protein M [Dermatophilaceae bacterium]|nr:stage II sporulation protein M [Actinomycetales bacterium]HMT32465.1 stage II sporulation protein M [Dermatophilaceae bacterium]HMT88339.1 stage II sporulation protein M [Dermatophilaceae bacterium]
MTATAASPSCPRPGRLLLTSAVFMAALYAVGVASGALGASLTREGSVGRSDTPAGVVDLFLHNSLVLALLGIGIVTAGLATGAQMLLNGTVLGWVVGKSLQTGTASDLLTGVLPHVFPEVAAYAVGGGASAALGLTLIARRRAVDRPWLSVTWRDWLRWQAIAVGLLALAAAIEGIVSHVPA